MKVSQLRNVLTKFAEIHERAGDVAKARGLRAFSDVLRSEDRRPVAKLVEKLRTARSS